MQEIVAFLSTLWTDIQFGAITMAFGIIHYMFLLDTVIMLVCVLLLTRKYLTEKNRMTLLFTLFISVFTVLCFAYFARGFFDANTVESILVYRISLVATAFAPVVLASFIFYPLILQKGGFKQAKQFTLLTSFLWIIAFISAVLFLIGDTSLSFSIENMDVYRVSYGLLSYLVILLPPVSTTILDAIMFGVMASREDDKFFRMRAMLLFLGWTLALVGQLTLLSASLMILNPILFGAGAMIMAIAILRKAPAS